MECSDYFVTANDNTLAVLNLNVTLLFREILSPFSNKTNKYVISFFFK